MDPATVMVVDDQTDLLDVINDTLSAQGHRVLCYADPQEAVAHVQDQRVDIVLTDLQMPGKDGLEVLADVKSRSPETEVVLMTAFGGIEHAVQAMKQGAHDFLTKPIRPETLTALVGRLAELQSLRRRMKELTGGVVAPVGSGEAMQRLLALARVVAESDSTVLILGETGVGKEVLADYIQCRSARSSAPFVKVNCAALPETLLESELFGHERGAFTGAIERRIGRFERAHGGTLFLDEIAELPVNVQVKLLRVLQSHEIERVGSTQTTTVDFRLIAATHQDLEARVREGRFREDLFYRINVFPVVIPPLRERQEDIPVLAQHFLARARHKLGRGPQQLHPDAVRLLVQHPWPGNVRQLENVIERACVLARGEILTPELIWLGSPKAPLTPVLKGAASSAPTPSQPILPSPAKPEDRGGVAASPDEGVSPGAREQPAVASSAGQDGRAQGAAGLPAPAYAGVSAPGVPLPQGVPDWVFTSDNPLEAAERAILLEAIQRCRWNFSAAAELLKVGRSTLHAKARKFGITRE